MSMKRLLFAILLFVAISARAEDFTILVNNLTGVVSGPFTNGPRPGAGQTVVTPTVEQLAALNALRKAHPGLRVVSDGQAFAIHLDDVLRSALIGEFSALTAGERALYKPAFEGVKAMLDANNLVEARKIIFLSPVPTEHLGAARLRMLALFPEP